MRQFHSHHNLLSLGQQSSSRDHSQDHDGRGQLGFSLSVGNSGSCSSLSGSTESSIWVRQVPQDESKTSPITNFWDFFTGKGSSSETIVWWWWGVMPGQMPDLQWDMEVTDDFHLPLRLCGRRAFSQKLDLLQVLKDTFCLTPNPKEATSIMSQVGTLALDWRICETVMFQFRKDKLRCLILLSSMKGNCKSEKLISQVMCPHYLNYLSCTNYGEKC